MSKDVLKEIHKLDRREKDLPELDEDFDNLRWYEWVLVAIMIVMGTYAFCNIG